MYKVLWLERVTDFSMSQDWLHLGPPPALLGPRKMRGTVDRSLKANLFERGRTSGMCVMGTAGFLVPVSVSSEHGYVIADSCCSLCPRKAFLHLYGDLYRHLRQS